MNPLSLTMTVGISGSGKSTLGRQYAERNNLIYLSSDLLRASIGKGEHDQDCSYIVFKTIENMTDYFLGLGKSVLLDATFLFPKARKKYLEIAKQRGAVTTALYVRTPMHIAMMRNLQRDRQVPNEVIQRQANDLVPPTAAEFDEVLCYD